MVHTYAGLVSALLDFDVDNPTAQAMAVRVAGSTAKERGPVLVKLARATTLPAETVRLLRADPNHWVRAAAWRRAGVTADELRALLATETNPVVRGSVLAHPGLDTQTYRDAVGRRPQLLMRELVLEHHAHLPVDLVAETVLGATGLDTDPTVLAAAARPGVADRVIVAFEDVSWPVRLAAATCPGTDLGWVADVLDVAPTPRRGHSRGAVAELLVRLAARPDLPEDLYLRVRDLTPGWCANKTLPANFPAAIGARSVAKAEQLTELLDSGAADSGALAALWDRLSDIERTTELAERILVDDACDGEVFTRVRGCLRDDTDAGLVEVFTRRRAEVRHQDWLVDYPRLAARYVTRFVFHGRAVAVRQVATEMTEANRVLLAGELIEASLSGRARERVTGDLWRTAATLLPATTDQLARVGLGDLADTLRATATEPELAARVARTLLDLLGEHPGLADDPTLVDLLLTQPGTVSAADACAAAAAAAEPTR